MPSHWLLKKKGFLPFALLLIYSAAKNLICILMLLTQETKAWRFTEHTQHRRCAGKAMSVLHWEGKPQGRNVNSGTGLEKPRQCFPSARIDKGFRWGCNLFLRKLRQKEFHGNQSGEGVCLSWATWWAVLCSRLSRLVRGAHVQTSEPSGKLWVSLSGGKTACHRWNCGTSKRCCFHGL